MNNAAKVDVLAVFTNLLSFGGTFEPKRIVPGWNYPRSTGQIADHLRVRARECDGRLVKHKTPATATVLRALERAARDGIVRASGTGAENRKTWRDLSAADSKERYWVLADAALASIEPQP